MASEEQIFGQAQILFGQHEFGSAEAACREILAHNPGHAGALHLSGLIRARTGAPLREAIGALTQAIALAPDNATYRFDCGNVLLACGAAGAARECFEDALRIAPEQAALHVNLGVALQAEGRPDAALASFAHALQLCPELAEAHCSLGNALRVLGRSQEALAAYDQAVAARAEFAEAWINRGKLLQELERREDALASFTQACAVRPDLAAPHTARGDALLAMGRAEEAVAAYDQSLLLAPDDAEVHSNRGNALVALGRHPEAFSSYARSIQLVPASAQPRYNLGNLLLACHRPSEALEAYDQAIELCPDFAEALINRANALKCLGRFDEALACGQQTVAMRPELAEAHYNLGNSLQAVFRYDSALRSYDRAIALRPDYAEAWWNKALVLLLKEDFSAAWPLYEWRWRLPACDALPHQDHPLWLGHENISGKTILLHCEQGFGDAIQFCRYIPVIAQSGARILLEAPAPLLRLLTTLTGVDAIIERGTPLPHFDMHCPLMSLPLACTAALQAQIPARVPYLGISPDDAACWQSILGPRLAPRVGVVWRGGTDASGSDRGRSIPLRQFLQALPAGFDYISLQKDVPTEDTEILQNAAKIRQVGEHLTDFAATAALCAQLDLIISIDTGVAHLAGALACPVWIILPQPADWRWGSVRTDSIWYPGMQLFRQHAHGKWEDALAQIRMRLLENLPESHSPATTIDASPSAR